MRTLNLCSAYDHTCTDTALALEAVKNGATKWLQKRKRRRLLSTLNTMPTKVDYLDKYVFRNAMLDTPPAKRDWSTENEDGRGRL